jgi:hypothetical protein
MSKLLNCKTCDGLISEEAITCPKCGQPDPLEIAGFKKELDSALGFVMYQVLVYTDNFSLKFISSNEYLYLASEIPGDWLSQLNDEFRKEDGNLYERFKYAFDIINQAYTKDQLKDLFFHVNNLCSINSKTEKSILIFGIVNVHIALSDDEKGLVFAQNILVDQINKNENIQLCSNCSFPIEYKVFQSGAICPNCKKYIKRKYSLSDWVWGTFAVVVFAIIAAKCSK